MSPSSPRKTLLSIAIGAVVAVVAVIAYVIWSKSPSVPSKTESERQLSQQLPAYQHTTVTAVCETPSADHEWHCRLRDGNGRYGYATGSVLVGKRTSGKYTYVVSNTEYKWGFPVAADGTVSDDVTLQDGIPAKYAVWSIAQKALLSVGAAAPALDAFTCPDVSEGQTVTCTGPPAMPSAQLTHKTGTDYSATFKMTLPA
ncbi:hypothetical protein GCM10009765_15110 [Fodinicola feengrottensis]|uniref:DUF4333 domain-containing protein n=1 Tax=Fodinicola feengrottensis TaxID=435914 RepID=A0ABN2G7V1_9ACTN